MKRSIVLELIKKELNGHVRESTASYLSERILRTVEEVGMLPPNTTKEVRKEIDNSTFEYIYDAFEWDVE